MLLTCSSLLPVSGTKVIPVLGMYCCFHYIDKETDWEVVCNQPNSLLVGHAVLMEVHHRDSKSLSGIPVSPGPASLLSFTFLNKLHNRHLFPHFNEEDSDLRSFG